MSEYAINQLSVFLENKTGELADVTDVLADGGVSIKSLLLVDSTDFGILRVIVDDTKKAQTLLKTAGISVKVSQVLAVRIADEVGAFAKTAGSFAKHNIDVAYSYTVLKDGVGTFIFKVDNSKFDQSVSALLADGYQLVAEKDLF